MWNSPGLAPTIAFSRTSDIPSSTFRRLVGTATTARCHPAKSWLYGIPASAVRNISKPLRSAAMSRSGSGIDRQPMWATVTASWLSKKFRTWIGRHSSIKTRTLCRGSDYLIRCELQDRDHIVPIEGWPRPQDLIEAQPVRQVLKQDSDRNSGSAKTRCTAHNGGVDRNQIGCLHDRFCLRVFARDCIRIYDR